VFAALVLTVLGALPQAALIAGPRRRGRRYNGHRLFAFAPQVRDEHARDVFVDRRGPGGPHRGLLPDQGNPPSS
jgi:hypothetical protein